MALQRLPHSRWGPLAEAHRARVEPLVAARLERRARGERHAVDDFLFDYYPYSPGKLATWHPGLGVVLEGPEAGPYLRLSGYRAEGDDGATADIEWLVPRQERLDVALRILDGTASRPPATGCFALHEWAMVYRLEQDEVRHASLPLRLHPDEIARTVDEVGLRCTHLDAYRFFTPDAVPLNALRPTREAQAALEQPGCLHAAMDLYKYAFWFSPLLPSGLVLDCFDAARRARALDMRASPYEVAGFGLEPIPVETAEGRRAYAAAQRELTEAAAPLRARLASTLRPLRAALAEHLREVGT